MTELAKLKLLLGISDASKDALLTLLMELSYDVAKRNVYPFIEDLEYVELGTRYDSWILQASKEMYQNLGNENVRKYSENGIAIEYTDLVNGLSYDLLSQLIPKVGVPK